MFASVSFVRAAMSWRNGCGKITETYSIRLSRRDSVVWLTRDWKCSYVSRVGPLFNTVGGNEKAGPRWISSLGKAVCCTKLTTMSHGCMLLLQIPTCHSLHPLFIFGFLYCTTLTVSIISVWSSYHNLNSHYTPGHGDICLLYTSPSPRD